MKKVIIAKNQGFCMGVRRALDIVANYPKGSILGDLIHNKQVVEKLEAENKKVIHEITGNEDHPVFITAHGTGPDTYKNLEKLGIEVVDTTCPLVRVIHRRGEKLEKEGYRVLILGDKNHIEVKGIAAYLHDPIIVDDEEDLKRIDLPEKLGVICQSTYIKDKFDRLVELIRRRVPDVKVENTICTATTEHQASAEELAHHVDLMIVVGGYHSSNTKKLALLTRRFVESFHIETAQELKPEWFKGKEVIGIVAGASTPDWIIEEVAHTIEKME